jgi:hypothetical protein
MWEDAYAKILSQATPTEACLLFTNAIFIAGMVVIWRAWRKDSTAYMTSVLGFMNAVARMREILVILKDRLPRHPKP